MVCVINIDLAGKRQERTNQQQGLTEGFETMAKSHGMTVVDDLIKRLDQGGSTHRDTEVLMCLQSFKEQVLELEAQATTDVETIRRQNERIDALLEQIQAAREHLLSDLKG